MDYSISTDYFTLQAIDESRLLRLAANKDVSRTTIPAKGPRSAVWAQLICDDDYQKLDTSESESDYCLNCRKKCPRQIKEATAWVSNNKNKMATPSANQGSGASASENFTISTKETEEPVDKIALLKSKIDVMQLRNRLNILEQEQSKTRGDLQAFETAKENMNRSHEAAVSTVEKQQESALVLVDQRRDEKVAATLKICEDALVEIRGRSGLEKDGVREHYHKEVKKLEGELQVTRLKLEAQYQEDLELAAYFNDEVPRLRRKLEELE